MPKLKLSEQMRWHVIYEDQTRFGSAVTNYCDQTLRKACAEIATYRKVHGLAAVVKHTHKLLRAAMSGPLAEIYENPDVLHQDWLYPDPQAVRPVALTLENEMGQAIAQIPLPTNLISDLASYLGEWSWGAVPPTQSTARLFWDALNDHGFFTEVSSDTITPYHEGVTFVGHSTLRIQSAKANVWIDPFILPKAKTYPKTYQPLGFAEMGKPDAVFITHSHPDHYDLSSLLRLGAELPLYVPEVERESVVAINMAFRLRQLGFRQVKTLRWFEESTVEDLRVIALPFYGEQATVGDRLHPKVRNVGNIYLIEWGNHRIGLTTDSGQDSQGDVKTLAGEVLQRYGPLDALFGGYRGFALYPIQYLFSSVARYLPFVPRALWSVRQQMMCDATDLIDLGEIWQAQTIIPYSDGGAPWYWSRGLGPVLDGSVKAITAVDPTPYSVVEAAMQRSGTPLGGIIASPVAVKVLNPGDSFIFTNQGTNIVRPQPWPYNKDNA